MKRTLFSLLILITIAACNNADQQANVKKPTIDPNSLTTIKWIDSLKDIGTVEAGKKVDIKFKFSNTGEKPLTIVKVQPGCGCTVADYPKEPVMPGKTGTITASYDVSTDGQGEFRKNMKVTTNTKGNPETYIFFYGKIKNDKVPDPQEKEMTQ